MKTAPGVVVGTLKGYSQWSAFSNIVPISEMSQSAQQKIVCKRTVYDEITSSTAYEIKLAKLFH